MDQAAIKAYSSVIADAAEDSEPQTPVQYHQTMEPEVKEKAEPFQVDPMGSMIQNEISAIKDASIAAAKEKQEEWKPWFDVLNFPGNQMNREKKCWDKQLIWHI